MEKFAIYTNFVLTVFLLLGVFYLIFKPTEEVVIIDQLQPPGADETGHNMTHGDGPINATCN